MDLGFPYGGSLCRSLSNAPAPAHTQEAPSDRSMGVLRSANWEVTQSQGFPRKSQQRTLGQGTPVLAERRWSPATRGLWEQSATEESRESPHYCRWAGGPGQVFHLAP